MKSREAIQVSLKRLLDAGRDEARLKAELLVAQVAGVARLDLLADPTRTLTEHQAAQLEELVARVAVGEPLQYVLGEAWFWGRRFKADRRALIPRPETEELVQRVLDESALWAQKQPVVADVGVGTGCIALTLAAERPGARVLGLDISPDALALARENETLLGLVGRVEWRLGDLLEGVPAGALDAVVSNPPYIAPTVIETLASEVRDYEPRQALDGGPDGLAVVRRLVAQAARALRPDGGLWIEIGDEQGAVVRELLTDAGFRAVVIHRDLSGHDRIAQALRV